MFSQTVYLFARREIDRLSGSPTTRHIHGPSWHLTRLIHTAAAGFAAEVDGERRRERLVDGVEFRLQFGPRVQILGHNVHLVECALKPFELFEIRLRRLAVLAVRDKRRPAMFELGDAALGRLVCLDRPLGLDERSVFLALSERGAQVARHCDRLRLFDCRLLTHTLIPDRMRFNPRLRRSYTARSRTPLMRRSVENGGRFGQALARLDPDAFAEFVAAAHEARPDVETTHLDGRCLVVRGREERRLRLVADRGLRTSGGLAGPATGRADVVVTQVVDTGNRAVAAHDAQLAGPADLRDLVCYGLAPDEADRLLADHLGLDRKTALTAGDRQASAGVAAALAALLVLVAGLLGTAVAGPVAPATPTATPGGGSTPSVESGVAAGLPPGLSPVGVTDAAALARAHEAALDERRYRFSIEARNLPALSGPGSWRELEASVVVAGPRTYRGSLGGVRVADRGTWWRLTRIYADGDQVYERQFGAHTPTLNVQPALPGGPEMDRGPEYARRHLAVRSAPGGNVTPEQVEGEWGHRVAVGTVPPEIDGESYRAVARVAESGRVATLDVGYVRPDGEYVSLAMRYEPTEERVRPPAWVDDIRADADAQNRSDGRETTLGD